MSYAPIRVSSKSYEPIRLDGPRSLYKTPIWIKLSGSGEQDEVTVWVGRDHIRHFKPDQLHDEIKAKLAFVFAADRLGIRPLLDDAVVSASSWAFHTTVAPPELSYLADIGWRVSKSCVCLIVSGDLIFKLRGESK